MALFKLPLSSETFTQLQLISVGAVHAVWVKFKQFSIHVLKTNFQN